MIDSKLESGGIAEENTEQLDEIINGLKGHPKRLPSKLFYDERGSQLFDRICELESYYPTRTETSILSDNIEEIVECLGQNTLFVEFGSGSSNKTRLLLDHAKKLAGYIPIDISETHLLNTAAVLRARYRDLKIAPLCADYTKPWEIPNKSSGERTVIFFPGSTIGNFEREDAIAFLKRMANEAGPDGGLIIGVDLLKSPSILNAAYNDTEGITEAFNKNILNQVNRFCSADFDPELFEHYAFFNPWEGRIEMHLISNRAHRVTVSGQSFDIALNEPILTEYSYKYDPADFEQMVLIAGWKLQHFWTDQKDRFGVFYFLR